MIARTATALCAISLGVGGATAAALNAQANPGELRVVTSLTTYATIAREIAGDRATVTAIAQGDENPHFVQPRPSFLRGLQQADVFVTTGLDLELWVPALLDRANNRRLGGSGSGYVTAYPGVNLLDVPESVSRSEGDIHIFGNPHIWTDPVNAILIGRNITTGLKRASPDNAQYFENRYQAWRQRVIRALAGDELVEILGADLVADLATSRQLWDFVHNQSFQGRPLADRLGGWLKQAAVFRGERMVCYHKEWDYFTRAFDVPCIEYVEPKPGIPPTPRHVADVIRLMRSEHIKVLFSTNYYDRNQVERVAARTGATAVIVPSNTEGAPGVDSYIDLVSLWVRELAAAFEASANR